MARRDRLRAADLKVVGSIPQPWSITIEEDIEPSGMRGVNLPNCG